MSVRDGTSASRALDNAADAASSERKKSWVRLCELRGAMRAIARGHRFSVCQIEAAPGTQRMQTHIEHRQRALALCLSDI
jgi:hypothetical protein